MKDVLAVAKKKFERTLDIRCGGPWAPVGPFEFQGFQRTATHTTS
jgi:hypothetical protein